MNDELQTLSRMFTERLFRIPDYQRGYAWTEEQLEDFWSDLCQIEGDRNHYTGVLTLENVPKAILKDGKRISGSLNQRDTSHFISLTGNRGSQPP